MKAHNRRSRQLALDRREANFAKMGGPRAQAIYCEDSARWKEEATRTMFPIVWNDHAPESLLSDEQKAVVQWGEEHLRMHRNFSTWATKVTSNLPFEAEWCAEKLFECEFVHWMHVAHGFCVVAFLSQLDASYPDRKNKMHMLQLGPGGTSKSYVLDVVHGQAIEGTVFTFNYSSAKAVTGRRNTDGGCLQMHEASDRAMGVGTGKSAADEALNFLKAITTSGRFTASVLLMDKDTGARSRVTFDTMCNNTMQLNSNRHVFDIEDAFRTRFFLAHYTQTEREDKSLLDCLGVAANETAAKVKKLNSDRYKQHQYLFTAICKMIEIGILAPVRVELARQMIGMILKAAEQRGLSSSLSRAPRTWGRMICIVRVLAILNAIRRVFDAPDSPVRNKIWEDRHLLLVEPFLRVKPQEVVIALGIAKQELVNPVAHGVLKAIQALFFSDNVLTEQDAKDLEDKGPADKKKPADDDGDDIVQGVVPEAKDADDQDALDAKAAEDAEIAKRKKRAEDYKKNKWTESDHIYYKKLLTYRNYFADRQPTDYLLEQVHYLKVTAEDFGRKIGRAHIKKRVHKKVQKKHSSDHQQQHQQQQQYQDEVSEHKIPTTEQERWQRMARAIRGQMQSQQGPKPSEELIIGFLRDMHYKQSIDVKVGDGMRSLALLDFTEDGALLVACRALISADRDIIRDAIEDVMSHANARPQRYAYEMRSVKTPFVFDCIDIKLNPANKRQQTNGNFADRLQRLFFSNLTRNNDGKSVVNIDKMFNPIQAQDIDMDMDAFDFLEHVVDIGWSKEWLEKHHFGDAHDTQVRLEKVTKKYYRYEQQQGAPPFTLPVYPDSVYVKRGYESKDFTADQDSAKESYPHLNKLSEQNRKTIETFGFIVGPVAVAAAPLPLPVAVVDGAGRK
jgi:hypothetical protein